MTARAEGERAFHVFYQLLKGAKLEGLDREWRDCVTDRLGDLLLEGGPNDYEFLRKTRKEIDGVDDLEEWRELKVSEERLLTLTIRMLWQSLDCRDRSSSSSSEFRLSFCILAIYSSPQIVQSKPSPLPAANPWPSAFAICLESPRQSSSEAYSARRSRPVGSG